MVISNSISSENLAFRTGGEEFSVLLPGVDFQGAAEIAETIRSNVQLNMFLLPGGKKVKVTASIGIASYPHNANNLFELIANADKALYSAKKGGRNRVA